METVITLGIMMGMAIGQSYADDTSFL